jgi:hypothetical protein
LRHYDGALLSFSLLLQLGLESLRRVRKRLFSRLCPANRRCCSERRLQSITSCRSPGKPFGLEVLLRSPFTVFLVSFMIGSIRKVSKLSFGRRVGYTLPRYLEPSYFFRISKVLVARHKADYLPDGRLANKVSHCNWEVFEIDKDRNSKTLSEIKDRGRKRA